ncbi:MAG: aromatic amino acid lyase [Nakamurella sp.]
MIELGAGTLTCEQICAIARDREQVSLDAGVAARLAAGHAAVQELAAYSPVYGRSTGVGALLTARILDVPAPAGSTAAQPDGLLRSHATTAGPPLPAAQIRAMAAVRIEQIAVGRSGLGPHTAAAMVELLNRDAMPVVGRFNSLGTGDVAPLARLALMLPAGALDAGDGLALMSSNALTIGRAALAVVDLDNLLAAATVVTALTFLARDGAAGALHAQAAGPFAGPQQVARVLRRLGAGSRRPARLQDQYGLRAAPQTLGIAIDAAAALRGVVTSLATAGLENPMVLDPPTAVVHHGGFHAVHLTAALDDAALALARTAVGSVNRLALLTEPPPAGDEQLPVDRAGGVRRASELLPPGAAAPTLARAFLAGGPESASGIMVLEYTAAAALGTVRAAAIPAATQTAGLSRGIEQDATYAPLAADQLAESIAAARVLIAVELVAAIRAIRIRALRLPAELLPGWAICDSLPTELVDRDLTDDVALAESLLDRLAPFGTDAGAEFVGAQPNHAPGRRHVSEDAPHD